MPPYANLAKRPALEAGDMFLGSTPRGGTNCESMPTLNAHPAEGEVVSWALIRVVGPKWCKAFDIGRCAGIGRPGLFAKQKVQRWASGFESLAYRQLPGNVVEISKWIGDNESLTSRSNHNISVVEVIMTT